MRLKVWGVKRYGREASGVGGGSEECQYLSGQGLGRRADAYEKVAKAAAVLSRALALERE